MKVYVVRKKIFWEDHPSETLDVCKRPEDVKRLVEEETEGYEDVPKVRIPKGYATGRIDLHPEDMPTISIFIEPVDMVDEDHFLYNEPT